MHSADTSTLLSTPPYFSAKSSGGRTTPKWNSYTLGVQMDRGTPGLQAFICTSWSAREERGLQTERPPGAKPEEEKGLFPCPAPDWMKLLQSTAAERNRERLSSLFSLSQKKQTTKKTPATSHSWRQIYVGHIPGSNLSKEPFSRFANLGKWGWHVISLAQISFFRRHLQLCLGWSLSLKSLWCHQQGGQSRGLQRTQGSARTCKISPILQEYQEETY